jgi:microcystin degradation protein MlrC
VLVSSGKTQMLDPPASLCGVEPAAMKILVNKSSVQFRAAFASIASYILVAQAPSPIAADPADLLWARLPAEHSLRP